MSSVNNNNPNDPVMPPQDTAKQAQSAPQSPATAAQLAHELANLLDGSMRHIGLAIHSLSENTPQTEPDNNDLLNRLQTTDKAMRQMASLVRAFMKAAPQPTELSTQSQTLGQTLKQIVDIHKPSAEHHNIELSLQVDPRAAALPAGPVFPVVANAILNSIEAIADMQALGSPASPADASPHHINIIARLETGTVWLLINDDGPGIDPDMIDNDGNLRIGHTTKPEGHGFGLSLSQQVANNLQGKLELRPRPEGGASLVMRYPEASLHQKKVSDTFSDAPK